MAQRLYDEDSVKNIANAIRAKNGSTETYNIDEMPTAIEKLSGASFETDSELSSNSENPVQNKVIKAALDKKQDIIQYSVMPEASADLANKIVQYIGNTTTTYTQGLFYKCINALTKYQWQKISVSSDGSKLDKPDTTSASPRLVTYSLATGTGIKNIDTSISSDGTDDGIPTSKAVSQYVQNSVSNKVDKVTGKGLSTNDFTNEDKAEVAKIAEKADISNPLQLSDTNLQKSGLLIQTYTPAGSTPGTVGTRTYSVIERDVNNLSESGLAAYNIPTSKAVAQYVKESISAEQSRADNTLSNALKGSKNGEAFLIDDISPVTREMGVKISSDTVENLTAVKIKKQGKNLIPFPYQQLTLGTSTYNGVDFTVYEDGSILINGTATKSTTKRLYTNTTGLLGLKSGITISISKNASDDTQQGNVYFVCNYYNSTGTMIQGLIATTAPSGTKTITDEWKGLVIYVNIPSGKTLNNLLIKPQLEIGATATEYEPYITPTEYIPTTDGTVNGITSLYPNTTLTTDTEGIIINCKYNRDINKAFAALEAAIATNNS
ncbi:MAG: hypothetical protein SPE03_05020 [Treponema sp.]|nr:hypothetical protein [Treponema sp.]